MQLKSMLGAVLFVLGGALFAAADQAPVEAAPAAVANTCEPSSLEAGDPAPEEVKKGDCSFKSDCGGAKCCKGRCAWASGSCCSFDSDCGFKGAKCRSGKCSNAPDGKCAFNSECPSGKCSSGKCK